MLSSSSTASVSESGNGSLLYYYSTAVTTVGRRFTDIYGNICALVEFNSILRMGKQITWFGCGELVIGKELISSKWRWFLELRWWTSGLWGAGLGAWPAIWKRRASRRSMWMDVPICATAAIRRCGKRQTIWIPPGWIRIGYEWIRIRISSFTTF